MAKSAIYTVNSSSPALAADAQIPFGSVIRRFGCNCQLDGDSISIRGGGYFYVSASISVQPTEAGEISAQLYKDGTAVPGAVSTGAADTAGNPVPLSIGCLVRNCGCDCNSVLSIKVSAACTLSNCSAVVEKI